jgi:hypothetical protein
MSDLWVASFAELVYTRWEARFYSMNEYDDQTYLEHIWVNVPKRQVKIMAEDGSDEVVTWKFDDEGSEGFSETISTFNEYIPEDMITYI